ncbi:MAG: hypothetical protein J6S90_03160 [Lentisphaeria bacterium]|nr:hypothetical protein [Lentisphaeria bacterium]
MLRQVRHTALFVLVTVCGTTAFAGDDVIAVVNGEKLLKSSLSQAAKQLLPSDTESDDVRDIRTRAAADFEIKLRTSKEILAKKNLSADRNTAERYIVSRCGKYGERGTAFKDGLLKLVNTPDFQLKCAIYFYTAENFPETIKLRNGEAEHFYRTNQLQYRSVSSGVYKVIEIPGSAPDADKKAADIRALLMQGANPENTAQQYGAVCRTADAKLSRIFAGEKLKKRAVSKVIANGQNLCVAVCISPSEVVYLPFEQAEPFIDEELLSRRCGAVFDKILKQELSLKNIEYRR